MGRQFVIYEVWTSHRIIEADDYPDAYNKGEPVPREGLSLSNWHAVAVDGGNEVAERSVATGALNYRQVD